MVVASKFRLLLKNVSVNAKVSEIKTFFKPVRIKDAKILKRGIAVAYFKSEKDLNVALQKQGTIHGVPVSIYPYENDLFDDISKTDNSKPTWEKVPAHKLRAEIMESGRLFVRNLSYDCTEAELLELFSQFGTVSEIHLSFDRKLQRSRGFAFISYLFPNDAVAAFNKLDKQKFKNRLLHILPGVGREDEPAGNRDKSMVSEPEDQGEINGVVMSEFQRKRHSELKSMASVSHNWNTLFVSPDAVATYLSAKFGVSKEQLHDATGKESAAVRLAHGEAQLVHEIRDFLQRNGVRLDLLTPESGLQGRRDKAESQSASTHRLVSGQVFLIKNLPVGTTDDDVACLLRRLTRKGAHSLDPPRRILVPPLGITAIVEYAMPQIARLAYKALAYEPYKDNVLYVQWAPEGILSPKKEGSGEHEEAEDDHKHGEGQRVKRQTREEANTEFMELLDAESVIQPNFSSGEPGEADNLRPAKKRKVERKEATDDAKIVENDIKLAKKSKRMRKDSAKLVEPADIHSQKSREREEQLQDSEFAIVRKPIVEGTETVQVETSGDPVKKEERSRVILVRNVAFQASQSEMTALFNPIGGLIKVRMPQKPSGGHRGFAFVEFATEDHAKTALETFGVDTHFMGRRLNIEYAKSG